MIFKSLKAYHHVFRIHAYIMERVQNISQVIHTFVSVQPTIMATTVRYVYENLIIKLETLLN
jgi:uncharacterized membrane protein